MPKVYVPQEPTRFDPGFNMRIPIVDLRPASKYGEVEVLLPGNVNGAMMSPVVTALKEKLAAFSKDDFIVAIGDPSIIAAVSGIILSRLGIMKLLRWDKRLKLYTIVEIEI